MARKPDPALVAFIREWLALAEKGGLREVVMVGRMADGEPQSAYYVHDLENMRCDLRTVVYMMRAEDEDEAPVETQH